MTKKITSEIIRKKQWKNLKVNAFNSELIFTDPPIGRLHPYTKTYDLFREVLLSFGLKEVRDKAVTAQLWHSDILGLNQNNKINSDNLCYFLERKTEIPSDLVKKLQKKYYSKYGERYNKELGSRMLLKAQTTSDLLEASYKLERGDLFTFSRIFRRRNYRKENYHCEILLSSERLSLKKIFELNQRILNEIFRQKIKIDFRPDYFPFTFSSFGMYGKINGYALKFGALGFLFPETSQLLGLKKHSAIVGFGINKITNSLLGLSPYEKKIQLFNQVLYDTDFKI